MSKTLSDAVIIGQPVLVRNTRPSIVVFDDVDTHITVQWAPAGDINGDDVQVVPMEALGLPAFTKNLRDGIIVVDDGPAEVLKAIDKVVNSDSAIAARQRVSQARAQAQAAATGAIIDPSTDDFDATPCIAPGTRAGTLCETLIPIRMSEKGTRAPLCPAHANLVKQAYPIEGDLDPATNKPSVTWALVTV